MSFTKAGATVKEKRIIAGAGGINDAFGGGDGEVVIGTNDKIIDSVFIIKTITNCARRFFEWEGAIFDELTTGGDFARANFGFTTGFNFKINGVDFYAVFGESFGDDVDESSAELLDVERVFDANNDVAIFG